MDDCIGPTIVILIVLFLIVVVKHFAIQFWYIVVPAIVFGFAIYLVRGISERLGPRLQPERRRRSGGGLRRRLANGA